MIIAIVGSRIGFRYTDIMVGMNRIIEHANLPRAITLVISGGAKGVDTFAKRWAKNRKIKFKEIPAKWKVDGKFHKGAGMIRNQFIVDESDIIVVFWDGKSAGSKNTYDRAVRADKRVILIQKVKKNVKQNKPK